MKLDRNDCPFLKVLDGQLLIKLHISPRAKKSQFKGLHGEALKVAIASPPVDGKANEELIKFLASELQIPKSQIQIVSGETSKSKSVSIIGMTAENFLALLESCSK